MPHSRVTASVEVNEDLQEQVAAAFQGFLDSLAIQGIAIIDSEISCVSASDVEGSDPRKRKKKP